jgi:outer membrane protein
MNRLTSPARARPLLVLLSLVVLLAGCGPRASDYGPQPPDARRKIRQIEPLELEKAEPNAPAPEANEPPPAVLELSLPDCRAQALQSNLQLKATVIDPAIAAAQLSAEEAKFESSFIANLNASKFDEPSIGFQGEITGSKRDSLGGDFGVQVPLRTGGTVTFDAADTWTKTNAFGTPFNPYYTSDLSVSLSQPLLQGAGRRASTYAIRIAGYNRDIVGAQTKLEIINVLAGLDRVYWRLYAARKELEVRKQQHDLALAQLDSARRLVNAGERPPVEIIRAEAGVAQQLEAIIVAENNLRDRERELKRVIHRSGLTMETPTVIVPTTLPDPVLYELDRPRFLHAAMDCRMELLELELQLLQDASAIDYMRNQALPVANLQYTYNVPGFGASQSDSFDLLFNGGFGNHIARLQATIPIGNEAAKSRLLQARLQRHQRLATRANREELIKQEVLNAVDQIETNWQRILAARQNVILNSRLYEAERRQFEQGQRTSTDVLNAQINFANAQSSEIQALAEYQIALVDLAYATGTILGADKLEWAPAVPDAGDER